MGRFENAEVFRDTERMCRENARLGEAIVLVYCRPGDTANYDAFAALGRV